VDLTVTAGEGNENFKQDDTQHGLLKTIFEMLFSNLRSSDGMASIVDLILWDMMAHCPIYDRPQ
jgi:hypothetical protein